MSQAPFTQNQEILTKLIRANEMKEIEKLKYIKNENNKILQKLEDISKGKQLSVGHHKIHPKLLKNKTLNYDKYKRQAGLIDLENTKILEKIMKVKPTVPDFRYQGAMQQYYLERISKCNKPDYVEIAKKRKHSSVLPTILNSECSKSTLALQRIPSYRKYLHKVDSLVGPIQ